MLVLTRCVGEKIVIGGKVHLTVVGIKGNRVRLGITAPANVPVWRDEILDRAGTPKQEGGALEHSQGMKLDV